MYKSRRGERRKYVCGNITGGVKNKKFICRWNWYSHFIKVGIQELAFYRELGAEND